MGVVRNSIANNYFLFNSQVSTDTITSTITKGKEINSDSLASGKKENSLINEQVSYSADDSIILARDKEKVFLYKNAVINYGNINLKADYIEYDQSNNVVYAKGMPDSSGVIVGNPVFKEDKEEFEAKTIKYNFKTKKGYIENIITEDQQGYLHSEITKKLENKEFNIKNGKYTTCDLSHPHFYLSMSKAKVIPGDKIVSGYSYLVIADIPLKMIFIPFGFFPTQHEKTSGILMPTYGEEKNRGFYLRDFGYYFRINDYMDLSLSGDIFSKGSWGGVVSYRLKKRYKYTSTFSGRFYKNILGDEGLSDYSKSTDFSIKWNHSQDAKANPSSKFSASVNLSSSSYDQLNSRNMNDYTTNTKSSRISYSKSWLGTPFRLSANFNHSQNSRNKSVDLTLPSLTFNMDRQYPFRKKNRSGDMKWYEDIEISYKSKMENRLHTVDSLLFTETKFSDFENGFQQDIPLRTNIKILNFLTISPQVKYTGILYPSHIRKYGEDYYDADLDSTYNVVKTDTIDIMEYAHVISPSISFSVSPRVYGMYQFKNPNSKIIAVRHVLSPSVSLNFKPDLGNMVSKYYSEYQNSNDPNDMEEYFKYSNGMYRLPSVPGKSGVISFGLNNNIEMKVRTSNDTASTEKKIKLLDKINFSTSYDLFADSLNWSPVRMNSSTSLFDKKLNIRFTGTLDPYEIDDIGNVYNEFVWNTSDKIFPRLTKFDVSFDYSLNSKKNSDDDENSSANSRSIGTFYDKNNRQYEEQAMMIDYVDFDVPWDLSVRYKFTYSKPQHESSISQTLSFSGNISLTQNWKISMRSNYDFEQGQLAATSINIHRDLHCWEMSFGWVPVGARQSYNFRINVKSSILQDLQLTKRKSWRDNL
jgi:lipopolysaccharide assembly outer membrane protein LptD (OstA)